CINAMIILNEAHLRHILTEYFAYYHEDRTHLGLGKEPPAGRLVSKKQGLPSFLPCLCFRIF
ncbi:MAG: hypothetical protein R6T89_04155, partial [Candidatus Syntrophosphaera sp.]